MNTEQVNEIIARAEDYLKDTDSEAVVLTLYPSLFAALLLVTESVATLTTAELSRLLATEEEEKLSQHNVLKEQLLDLRVKLEPYFEGHAGAAEQEYTRAIRKDFADQIKHSYVLFIRLLYSELQVEYNLDKARLDELFDIASFEELIEFESSDLQAEFVDTYDSLQDSIYGYERMHWMAIHVIRLYLAYQLANDGFEFGAPLFDLLCRTLTTFCVVGEDEYSDWDPEDPGTGVFVYYSPFYPYPPKVFVDQAGEYHSDKDIAMLKLAPAETLYESLKSTK